MKKLFNLLFATVVAISSFAESKVIDFTVDNQLNLPTATKAAEYYKEDFTVTDSETGYTFTFTADAINGWAYQNNASNKINYLILGKAGASIEITTTEVLDSIIVTGKEDASAAVQWSVYEGEEELSSFTGAKEVYTIYTNMSTNVYTFKVNSAHNMQITKIEFFYTDLTPTSINNITSSDKVKKVIKDGHIYIINNNKTYNVQGVCL